MSAIPTDLQLVDGERLRIRWSDQVTREYTPRELLDNCPCASCREKRKQPPVAAAGSSLPVVTAEETEPLTINSMTPVGSYAYAIRFSRGCDKGIYTFESLCQLGRQVE